LAAAVVPTDDVTERTSGSRATIAATSCWDRNRASNDAPSAASVIARSCPVSSVGKSPLGIAQKSQPVAIRITAEKTSVAGRWRITHARLLW
jgi:hypothetical protein